MTDSCHANDVTIIVCTRNRADALRSCLASISVAIAHTPKALVEVVVVNNGSTDHTGNVIEEWKRSAPCSIRVVDQLKPGLGAARNGGVKQAQGKYIAFTDDDCRLAPDYLNRMLAHFENDGRPAIRGGMVKLGDPTDLPTAIKERPEQLVLTYPMHPGTVALGCNMAMSREVFAQIGLFDERFGAGTLLRSAEETEFFYRAFQHSIPVIYVPDMIVFHFHGRKTLESMRKQIVSYAIGTGGMAAKHAFSSTLLSRHVYWDARAFVRDLRSGGRSSRWREASEFTWLTGVLRGIGLFWLSSLIRRSNAKGREA